MTPAVLASYAVANRRSWSTCMATSRLNWAPLAVPSRAEPWTTERWTPEQERPEVLAGRITWHPDLRLTPFELDLPHHLTIAPTGS